MNNTKYIKLIPLMLLTMFLLSGCVSLQDLKDDHAILTDASKKEIIWQGKRYLYLTDSSVSNFNPEYDLDNYINITEKDVPTLLAEYDGSFGYVSKDGTLIKLYASVYCLEDKFEEMKKLLDNPPELNCLAYQYYENDEYATARFVLLDKDKTKQLEEVLEQSTVERDVYEYFEVAELFLSSENGMFNKYNDVVLCRDDYGQYCWGKYEGEDYTGYKTYEIPKEYISSIEKIFADAIEVADEQLEYWIEDEYEEYEL